MPLIRCGKCGQAYDIPGVIAVRLPNSIATCHCGEWLSGSKAAILARMLDPSKIKEVDLQPYRVDAAAADAASQQHEEAAAPAAASRPRSIRVIARGAKESINKVFTIHEHPLWIGRRGTHVELAEAELSLQHCSISVRGDKLVVRDADSHTGTFLDGQQIKEATIEDGMHLLRVGSALITIEPTDEAGVAVVPLSALESASTAPVGVVDGDVFDAMTANDFREAEGKRTVLVCIAGPLDGQEFEIPPTGLIVGREGHVRVPDEFLSRRHFEVARDPDGTIRVRDLGSRNGTFLNTLPAKNTKVHAGDEIQAGVNRFKIEQRA
jgi:pSer/pThr/pTyr-binding forkhead associated (FHA) protein